MGGVSKGFNTLLAATLQPSASEEAARASRRHVLSAASRSSARQVAFFPLATRPSPVHRGGQYDLDHMVAILLANDTCAVSDRRLRRDASVKEMAGCGNSRGDW
ncbi:hypothetical protein RB195_009547 [Necator americanus]|uniref:Uncharacterized protein n=1 Tax=Necator americanus TaxID=51031 RepID=A0ABR1CUC5_NECAM